MRFQKRFFLGLFLLSVTLSLGVFGCSSWTGLYFGSTGSGASLWIRFQTECTLEVPVCADVSSSLWDGAAVFVTGYSLGPLLHLEGSGDDVSVTLDGRGLDPLVGGRFPVEYLHISGSVTVTMEEETQQDSFLSS